MAVKTWIGYLDDLDFDQNWGFALLQRALKVVKVKFAKKRTGNVFLVPFFFFIGKVGSLHSF